MNKMSDIQFDFVSKVLVKIKAAVNGRVKYKYFDQLDAVIFTVYFKDFQFEFSHIIFSFLFFHGTSSSDALKLYTGFMISIISTESLITSIMSSSNTPTIAAGRQATNTLHHMLIIFPFTTGCDLSLN